MADDSKIALTSKSMLSRIVRNVLTLPQTLIVGATMLPIGLPTPVPKQISWQPPIGERRQILDRGRGRIHEVQALAHRRLAVARARPRAGACRPWPCAPSAFSSTVVRPPRLLSGAGCESRMLTPRRTAMSSMPRTASQERLLDGVVDGARREQVLGADELGGLRDDDRAAVVDQPVGHAADRRVAAQAGRRVRAAALDADDEIATSGTARAAGCEACSAMRAASRVPSRDALDRAVRLQVDDFDRLAATGGCGAPPPRSTIPPGPTSRTPAMLGLRPMPASESSANSRSAPNWPRTNSVVTGIVPATACAIARVTGLQLSITEITATQLRTPAAPLARR